MPDVSNPNDFKNYRSDLAQKLTQTPKNNKTGTKSRKELLEESRETKEYQTALLEHFVSKIEERTMIDNITQEEAIKLIKESYIKIKERLGKLSGSEIADLLITKNSYLVLYSLIKENYLKPNLEICKKIYYEVPELLTYSFGETRYRLTGKTEDEAFLKYILDSGGIALIVDSMMQDSEEVTSEDIKIIKEFILSDSKNYHYILDYNQILQIPFEEVSNYALEAIRDNHAEEIIEKISFFQENEFILESIIEETVNTQQLSEIFTPYAKNLMLLVPQLYEKSLEREFDFLSLNPDLDPELWQNPPKSIKQITENYKNLIRTIFVADKYNIISNNLYELDSLFLDQELYRDYLLLKPEVFKDPLILELFFSKLESIDLEILNNFQKFENKEISLLANNITKINPENLLDFLINKGFADHFLSILDSAWELRRSSGINIDEYFKPALLIKYLKALSNTERLISYLELSLNSPSFYPSNFFRIGIEDWLEIWEEKKAYFPKEFLEKILSVSISYSNFELTKEVQQKIIDAEMYGFIGKNLNLFNDESLDLSLFPNPPYIPFLIENLSKFKNLEFDYLSRFIDLTQAYNIMKLLDKLDTIKNVNFNYLINFCSRYAPFLTYQLIKEHEEKIDFKKFFSQYGTSNDYFVAIINNCKVFEKNVPGFNLVNYIKSFVSKDPLFVLNFLNSVNENTIRQAIFDEILKSIQEKGLVIDLEFISDEDLEKCKDYFLQNKNYRNLIVNCQAFSKLNFNFNEIIEAITHDLSYFNEEPSGKLFEILERRNYFPNLDCEALILSLTRIFQPSEYFQNILSGIPTDLELSKEIAKLFVFYEDSFLGARHSFKEDALDDEIFNLFYEKRGWDFLVNFMSYFSGLSDESLSKIFQAEKYRSYIDGIYYYLSKFENISEKNLLKILEAGHLFEIAKLDYTKNFINTISETDFEKYFDKSLSNHYYLSQIQQRDSYLIDSLKNAFKKFGNQKILEFISREEDLRNSLLILYEISLNEEIKKLDSSFIFNNILNQIKNDTSMYGEYSDTNSYQRFLELLRNLKLPMLNVFFSTETKIPEIDSLIKFYLTESNDLDIKKIFSSWQNFKKFSELAELIQNNSLISALSNETNQDLRNYLLKIAFHIDSKVSIDSALAFYQFPANFLDTDDIHSDTNIHERRKPIRFTQTRFLDLDAGALRDALVNGDLDRISVFKPFEVEFVINKATLGRSLRELLKEALGSKKEGIPAKAKNATELYNQIFRIFKKDFSKLQSYLSGKISDTVLESQIREVLFNKDFGYVIKESENITFVAQIFLKKDATGAVAGDDTASCDNFGSGKNNVYNFGPNNGLFAIRLKLGDGRYKTIAQSVITKDIDLGEEIGYEAGEYVHSGRTEPRVDTEIALQNLTRHIACDNIEFNTNNQKYKELIWQIYQEFFKLYIQEQNSKENNFSPLVVIGSGHGDIEGTDTIPNTFIPQNTLGYTDKTGELWFIPTNKIETGASVVRYEVRATEEVSEKQETEIQTPRISYLTFEDAFATAYLEEKIYNNPNLIVGQSEIQNILISKDIHNSTKDRPNMSLKYRTDGDNKISGYIISYEGIDGGINNGEPFLYIFDFAAESGGGYYIMQEYINLYIKNYLMNGKKTPIYMEARDNTSYQLLKRALPQLLKKRGIAYELEEYGSYSSGSDEMHQVLIRIP